MNTFSTKQIKDDVRGRKPNAALVLTNVAESARSAVSATAAGRTDTGR